MREFLAENEATVWAWAALVTAFIASGAILEASHEHVRYIDARAMAAECADGWETCQQIASLSQTVARACITTSIAMDPAIVEVSR